MKTSPAMTPRPRPPQPKPVWRWLGWAIAIALMLGVFSLYGHPDFMVDMADRLWSCF